MTAKLRAFHHEDESRQPIKRFIKVQIITDSEQWNDFLLRHPQGHLLQSYEWGNLYQVLGVRVYRLGAEEDGRMIGAMMLSVSPVPFARYIPGRSFHWLYCCRGPVMEHPDAPVLKALLEQAHAIARQERAVVLRLEPNIVEDDPEKDRWLELYQAHGFRINPISTHGKSSWVLDIRPSMEDLRAHFRKAWRQDIMTAERMGVKVREAETSADFDAYYDLLQKTSHRDKFFIHSKEYHQEILRQFTQRGNAALFLAEHEGEAIAAKMVIRFGDWCWDMFAGMSNNKPALPKTHLLQYHCLRWAKDQGCSYFDFRTIPDAPRPGEELWGVYHYKKGFGGYPRRHIPTLDFVYRPPFYWLWRLSVRLRRTLRSAQHTYQKKKSREKLVAK